MQNATERESRSEKLKHLARELECDENEGVIDKKLGEIAKAKPEKPEKPE